MLSLKLNNGPKGSSVLGGKLSYMLLDTNIFVFIFYANIKFLILTLIESNVLSLRSIGSWVKTYHKKEYNIYARKRVKDTYSFFTCFIYRKQISFSWCIFIHKPIHLKLDKRLPLIAMVRILYLHIKICQDIFFLQIMYVKKKEYASSTHFRALNIILFLMVYFYA